YLAQENPNAAIKNYEEALKAAESIGALDLVSMIRQWLGAAYKEKGDFALALSSLEEASRLASQLGDKNRLAEISCFQGEVHYSMGDYSRASKLADWEYKLNQQ